jgi:hypothetical protein
VLEDAVRFAEDFATVVLVGAAERAGGHPSLPVKSVRDLIALAKQDPAS